MGKMVAVVDIDDWENLVNETTRYDINALMKNGCEVGDHWNLVSDNKPRDRGQVNNKQRYKEGYEWNEIYHSRSEGC